MKQYFGSHTVESDWHALLPRYLVVGDRVDGRRVLDIGCGTGIGSSLLLELGAAEVVGVDDREDDLDLAGVKHDKQGLSFQLSDQQTFELPDHHFDLVVCLDPRWPTTDPDVLEEISRLLNEGGEYVCALERTKVSGLERLLQAGRSSSRVHRRASAVAGDRVPQVGRLSEAFESVVSLVQRPRLSYVFVDEEPVETRDSSARTAGGTAQRATADDDRPEADDSPRFGPTDSRLPVASQLTRDDAQAAAVAMYFCGDHAVERPVPRDVRLPYYAIVNGLEHRLQKVQFGRDLDETTSPVDDELDGGLDEPTDSLTRDRTGRDDSSGLVAQSPWDACPTSVHTRPASETASRSAPAPAPPTQAAQLDAQVRQLTSQYRRMRRDFEVLIDRTRDAIFERDGYIDHLVDTIHQRQSMPADANEPTGSRAFESAPTKVFEANRDDRGGPQSTDDDIPDLLAEREQRLDHRDTPPAGGSDPDGTPSTTGDPA